MKSRRKSTVAKSRRKSTVAKSRRKSTVAKSRRKSTVAKSRRKSTVAKSRRKSTVAKSRRIYDGTAATVGVLISVTSRDLLERVARGIQIFIPEATSEFDEHNNLNMRIESDDRKFSIIENRIFIDDGTNFSRPFVPLDGGMYKLDQGIIDHFVTDFINQHYNSRLYIRL